VKKDFEKYRISYVLIVNFADPEIILIGECITKHWPPLEDSTTTPSPPWTPSGNGSHGWPYCPWCSNTLINIPHLFWNCPITSEIWTATDNI